MSNLIKNKLDILKKDKNLLKYTVEKTFTFGDLDSSLANLDASMGNIFCPFHENHESPAAKVYYNEDKDINTIHCFSCGRQFTSYDYIERIIQQKPYEYLINNANLNNLLEVVEAVEKGYLDLRDSYNEQRLTYINNTYEEVNNNTIEYISRLYRPDLYLESNKAND